jgi:anaerobic ribonucleoside-triphosphate reductase
LDDWEALTEQLQGYAEQIHDNMATYDKERAEEAHGLLQSVESFITQVDNNHRTELENQIGALESFLAI